ncbi:MAG: TipAS antibiotic-recognition domain-containing protein, partial [Croceibacterium sp.]
DWLVEHYGGNMRERLDESRAAFTALGKDGMAARLAEGEAAGKALAKAFRNGDAPDDAPNYPLFARHHAWVAAMWDKACPPQAYAGMADLYLEHPDFRTKFDGDGGEGFTDWLKAGMKAYAGRFA